MAGPSTPVVFGNSDDHGVGTSEIQQDGAEELGRDGDDQTNPAEEDEVDEILGLCAKCGDIDFDVLLDPNTIAGLEDSRTERYVWMGAKQLAFLEQPASWSL